MITIESKNIEYAQAMLDDMPKQIRAAANSAINRTLTTVRAKSSKSIRDNYLISSKDVKGRMSIKRSNKIRLTGVVKSTGAPMLITAFRVRTRKKGPIRVQIRKQGAPKAVPGMFLGTSRKGFVGAMQRTKRNASYPLRIPYGPSVPQMFGSENVVNELVPLAEETLNKRFLHEVNYRFDKMHGGK